MEFLPLTRSGEWPDGARKLLVSLSQSGGAARGSALYKFICDMRQELGFREVRVDVRDGLEHFFRKYPSPEFFQSTLPWMAKLALELPALVKKNLAARMNQAAQMEGYENVHLRVLETSRPGVVFLSQELAAALVTCSFFCLFPSNDRNDANPSPEKNGRFPYVNFDRFFGFINFFKDKDRASQEHKMLCILHYFERVSKSMPKGVVSFERKVVSSEDANAGFWSTSTEPLCEFIVLDTGSIEGHQGEALEIDFADMFLGGRVLGSGCVQEEACFLMHPELIAGMLFLPKMEDNEAIEIFGAERYNNYKGYDRTFAFAGDHTDTKPRDAYGRRTTRIVAIDAKSYKGGSRNWQYQLDMILRDLNKAYCGFLDYNQASRNHSTGSRVGLATGNWGCGVFGGDPEFKSMIQWLAASKSRRPFVQYYTFGDARLSRLKQTANRVSREGWKTGELFKAVREFGMKTTSGQVNFGFFQWLAAYKR